MNTKRNLLGLMGGAALLPLLASTGPLHASAPGPKVNAFPNFVLETHEGRKVKFYDDLLKNKIVVINMLYTYCSGICPANTSNLLQVQQELGKRLGRDIFMYSLTLQPEFDRPEALNAYVKQRGIKPGWTLLTGKPAEMEQIRRRLGFVDSDPIADADLSNHTGVVRVGNVALDRWFMMPAMSRSQQISRAILEL
ncbi:SCO family protein [Polaromonas sp.]|uniref:SCO family protein n=1 Tax=Polaromonas sp. TaxID=1869339 RepID=UPI00286A4E41|nr:SCO family protein [Polaromonas sp.]